MNYRAILLVGPPGSGKGTLARSLSASSHFLHCSCGDVFRALDGNSALGQMFQRYATKGLLVPDEVTVDVWLTYVARCENEGKFRANKQTILLDGIPRNANQAKLMASTIEVLGVLQLDHISRTELISRLRQRALKEGRSDDAQDEVIQRRLDLYECEANELLACYPPDRLCRLDATQPPVEVLQEAACNLVRFFTAASSPSEKYRSIDGSIVAGSDCIEVTAAIKKQR